MKTENKVFIKTFFLAGAVYAGLMTGFDYADGQEFRIYKFLFHFLFFGLFMGFLSVYSHKKQAKKKVTETDFNKPSSKTE